jgi:hypothetical protein
MLGVTVPPGLVTENPMLAAGKVKFALATFCPAAAAITTE